MIDQFWQMADRIFFALTFHTSHLDAFLRLRSRGTYTAVSTTTTTMTTTTMTTTTLTTTTMVRTHAHDNAVVPVTVVQILW